MAKPKKFMGKGKSKFAIKYDDGDTLEDVSLDDLLDALDDLEDVMGARGFVRKGKMADLLRPSDSLASAASEARAAFAAEAGAPGKSPAEIKTLVDRALNPPKPEATLLAETIGAETGRIDKVKLDALDDSAAISRSAWRRATEAEERVSRALTQGKITPAMLKTGAPLRLALSDQAAFKALVEDRPAIVQPGAVTGLGGSAQDQNASPRQRLAALTTAKAGELMRANASLSDQAAFQQASMLVRKEHPELFEQYQKDVKSR